MSASTGTSWGSPDRSASAARIELVEFGATPVLKHFWPRSEELNAGLRDVILARMRSSHGVVDTNVGGWHSERDLAKWNEPPVSALLERVRVMIRELVERTVTDPTAEHLENWSIEGWANVNRRGAFNKAHHHAGGRIPSRNLWSGIYYVDDGGSGGDRPRDGLTKFEDRSGVPKEILRCADPFERELTIVPQPGLMVFFPATLRHYVTPYAGESNRITIALNLKHPGFVIPRYQDDDVPSFLWRNFRGPMLVASSLKQALRRGRPRNGGGAY
jgi:uncharacterized protein (TIGR02466 family)